MADRSFTWEGKEAGIPNPMLGEWGTGKEGTYAIPLVDIRLRTGNLGVQPSGFTPISGVEPLYSAELTPEQFRERASEILKVATPTPPEIPWSPLDLTKPQSTPTLGGGLGTQFAATQGGNDLSSLIGLMLIFL